MTLLARRIYYSLALLAFFIIGPIILLPAAGFEWAGWRLGFIRTGALVVTVTPKATLTINGRTSGTSTKFSLRRVPGQYAITLLRPGYHSWNSPVGIEANTASLIGPVNLLPVSLSRNDLSSPEQVSLVSQDHRTIVAATANPNGWQLQQH